MKDWKWASVKGCPERMMAAKSHSISSVRIVKDYHPLSSHVESHLGPTLIEICFIKVIRSGDVHIVQACNLRIESGSAGG